MVTKKIKLNELKTIIKEIIKEEIEKDSKVNSRPLNEDVEKKEIDDFFNMLEQDPKKNSFAYVYYVAPFDSSMNKTIKNNLGEKTPNPMYGKIFKNTVYLFNYGKTYKEAIEKKNPEWEIQKRSGNYEKVDGFSVLEFGKDGKLILPIADPIVKYSSYIYYDGNELKLITKEELTPYLPERKPYESASGVSFRNLNVDRVYKLSAGNAKWINSSFKFQELKEVLK